MSKQGFIENYLSMVRLLIKYDPQSVSSRTVPGYLAVTKVQDNSAVYRYLCILTALLGCIGHTLKLDNLSHSITVKPTNVLMFLSSKITQLGFKAPK